MKSKFIGNIILLIAATFLFQACSSPVKDTAEISESEKELVRSIIQSPERAENVIELLAQRDELVASQVEMIGRYQKKMKKLNADYATDQQSFEHAIAEFNKERMVRQNLFLELIVAMKKATTAQEWEVIAKYQLDNMKPRTRSYQKITQGV